MKVKVRLCIVCIECQCMSNTVIYVYVGVLIFKKWGLYCKTINITPIILLIFWFRYMCKLSDKDLRMAGNRNMTELMWAAVKEPLETHFQFDKEGLDLAFKYFTCSTLTIRLAGIAQINVRRISIGLNTCNLIFKNPSYFHRKYFAC